MTTAILAAYLLVLQALLGGMAAGAHAGNAFAIDEFGQVICRGAMDGAGSPADPAHHTPDCCTTGCNVSIGAGTPPPTFTLAAPRGVTLAAAVAVPAEIRRASLAYGPHNARAPPLA